MADQHCPFCKTVLAYGTCVNTNCTSRFHPKMQNLLSGEPIAPGEDRRADAYARQVERAERAEAERDKLRDALERLAAGEDAPRVPMLAAGVEDRDLQADGYAAVEYGWQEAEERYLEWIQDEVAAVLKELESAQ